MTGTRTVLLMLSAAALLAGCSDAPPSGEFTLAPGPLTADGSVEIAYQEFEDPLNQASGPNDQLCTLRPPELGQSCVPPSSSFSIDFPAGALPAADPAMPYTAYFVGAEETVLGPLAPAGDGYTLNHTFDAYMGDQAGSASIQVRMGDVPVATASAAEGIQSFAPASEVRQVSGEGSFRGKELQVTIAGLPQNATAMGWFVMDGEDGETEHVVSFQVSNGENTYTAEQNVASYDGFHVHLGNSALNLAVAPLSDE